MSNLQFSASVRRLSVTTPVSKNSIYNEGSALFSEEKGFLVNIDYKKLSYLCSCYYS